MAADKAVTALRVPERHQLLAHEPHRFHRPITEEFVDQSGRLPIAPEQRTGRRSGARAGDEIVLFRAKHGFPGPFVDRTFVRF
jgi:hypothetical protein